MLLLSALYSYLKPSLMNAKDMLSLLIIKDAQRECLIRPFIALAWHGTTSHTNMKHCAGWGFWLIFNHFCRQHQRLELHLKALFIVIIYAFTPAPSSLV